LVFVHGAAVLLSIRSPGHVVPRRNRSLGRKPIPVATKRSYDEAFFNDNDDWIFHPALDPYMEISKSPSTSASSDGPSFPPGGVLIGGALPSLLLDFQPPPKTPHRNWRNVLHQQRLKATLHQRRDANEQDDLGQEEAADSIPLTPYYTLVSSLTCNLTLSSMLFSSPPLPWSNDLIPLSRPWQPNSIRTRPSTLTIRSLKTTFVCTPGPGSGMLQCHSIYTAYHKCLDCCSEYKVKRYRNNKRKQQKCRWGVCHL